MPNDFPQTVADPNLPLDLTSRNVHFVGIGGCGMSGLARIVRARGANVTGSDMTPSPYTDSLITDQINVIFEQTAASVPANTDLLVISAAIKGDHPELATALSRSIPVLKYAQLLGRLMIDRTGVAIAGTHGKSTTTAMLAHTLIQTKQDPTFIVGATCDQIGGGARTGRPDLLIGEACEYDRSFLNFHPTHAVVLNLEEDHLDIYGSLDNIITAFHEFAQQITPNGSLLIAHESAYRTAVAAGLPCKVETIGYAPQADYQIQIIPSVNQPHQRVSISYDGQQVVAFDCQLPGEHMAYNASVAAVTAHRLGANWQGIGEALSSFQGLDRRMQNLGTHEGVTVVDDYGHHPTEIDTTLRALRNHHRPQENGGRLVCVFQPHQHSRTRFLLDQFATSFAAADVVIVPHIYFVRDSEADRKAVSAADLVNKLNDRNVTAYHIDSFDEILQHLRVDLHPNDLLVVMGAGPVWQIGHRFAGREV